MPNVHKSLRIEEETAAAVTALKSEGESEAAAYNRVLKAGLTALEEGAGPAEATAQDAPRQPTEASSSELIKAKDETIALLKEELADAKKQLATTSNQLSHQQRLTDQEQQLRLLTGKKPSFFSRLFAGKKAAEPAPADAAEVVSVYEEVGERD